MKPVKNQATSIAGLSALSAEAKICFGAAGGCFVLGMLGYAINALTTTETTLSAFLVISAFYFLLGVISVLKVNPEAEMQAIQVSGETANNFSKSGCDDDLVESAA
jgi:hypothetical protein